MPTAERTNNGRLLYALIGLLALTPAGCLLALAGVAGGAAATGYFYCKGRVYRDYPAPLPDVTHAVHAALLDLHFAIFNSETKDGKAFFVTRTTNGKKVRIYLDCLTSPVPSDGLFTRVSIRVGAFGNDSVSARIFDQTHFRLEHPAPLTPVPPPTAGPPTISPPAPIQPTGFQTSEPKLAPNQKK